MSSAAQQTVEALWQAFDRFDFAAAGELLDDDFVCEWPQSGEIIRGRDNFVTINAHYPGRWRITVQRIVAQGDHVVTEITARDTKSAQSATAVSFFTVQDGKVVHLREFWPDPFEAPAWRAQGVERATMSTAPKAQED
jgi:ketosteroid isomerase-like protein